MNLKIQSHFRITHFKKIFHLYPDVETAAVAIEKFLNYLKNEVQSYRPFKELIVNILTPLAHLNDIQ